MVNFRALHVNKAKFGSFCAAIFWLLFSPYVALFYSVITWHILRVLLPNMVKWRNGGIIKGDIYQPVCVPVARVLLSLSYPENGLPCLIAFLFNFFPLFASF